MIMSLGDPTPRSVPVMFTCAENWPHTKSTLSSFAQAFADAANFTAAPGVHLIIPDPSGAMQMVVFAMHEHRAKEPFLPGKLAYSLPAGRYHFTEAPGNRLAMLGFLLSSYEFTRYRQPRQNAVVLEAPDTQQRTEAERIARAVALGRDLINTPANDMGPDALEQAARDLAGRHGAKIHVIRGDDLLAQNFPLIHAVGRAAAQEPRLVDVTWGDDHTGPAVTLVGKGVCFDTGGLNIKPDASMLLMKKDMGGAATAMALAEMIMSANLPLRLRLILPVVENAISATAFRPGDIYPSRKGKSIEIGNTDAEGRLILADALTYADEAEPDILLDFATLTGAARVALGPDLPPFFTGDEELATAIASASETAGDPVWRLPLWQPYDTMLKGRTADLSNVAAGGFAGAIIAALFLQHFVSKTRSWAHFDVYGWNPATKPGRPEGGEIQAARLVFEMLKRQTEQ